MNTSKPISDISSISDFFLMKDGDSITNKKLQKLVYYAQAWSLVLLEKPLFDDDIEAWIHGPAIKSLYRKYRKFGWQPIETEIDSPNLPQNVLGVLEQIWKIYGKFDAEYLERLTHRESPWINTRRGLDTGQGCNRVISHKEMKDYYSKLLEN
jgi:uncharacterized phage-associated protein